MMAQKYLNPPIVEVVAEFRLTTETKWDLTIPGLLYEKLRDSFPHKEQVKQEGQPERIRFLSPGKTMFVQVESRVLSVNCIKPYPSWDSFKPKIQEAFDKLRQILGSFELEGIALRFINRIEIPSAGFDFEEYFNFRPFLGEKLPTPVVSFFVGCMFRFAKDRDLCRIHLTDAVPENQQSSAFNMVLEYFLLQQKAIPSEHALSWINEAHHRLEDIFEGSITDKLRQLFWKEN
jgi:uncharacterized protein (TIGR04255 family)